MKKYLSILLSFALILGLLGGCGETDSGSGNLQSDPAGTPSADEGGANSPSTGGGEAVLSQSDAEMFTDRDLTTTYDEGSAVRIELLGTSATASSDSVKIVNSTVQITEEATYIISGTLTDGMLVVNAPDTAKLHLIFDGVSITSGTSAALYILEADKVVVTLAEGTENALVNGGVFTAIDDNNIDAALFSKQDLTINGSGSLTVTSPAGHGITSNDDLVITGGSYDVSAASHAFDANDSIRIVNADITAVAGKDGLHAENNDDTSLGFVYISSGSIKIEAEGDGISAGAYAQINDGTFDILAGGGSENGEQESSGRWGGFMGGGRHGSGHGGRHGDQPGGAMSTTSATTDDDSSTSMKGIKSVGMMVISGGTFSINSADDAVHSDTSLTIDGGNFAVASGDDAFHAEDTLTVNAGTIGVTESYEGLEALHVAVYGGDISLMSRDDGVNAAGGTDSSGATGGRDGMFGGRGPGGMMSGNSSGSVVISGGTLRINASGDGIDANGTLEITGGYTVVTGPTQGDTAVLDYDRSATISGGTFIGTGASMMAQTFSDTKQGVLSISVGSQSAGTQIIVTDKNGAELLNCAPELSFQIVIVSAPELVSGESYTVTVGSQSSTFEAD